MPVSYIVCAAGSGTRTKAISGVTAKPFLRLNNRLFLEWAIDSLAVGPDDQVIVVLLQEHRDELQKVQAKGSLIVSNLEFHFLDKVTRGQAETALLVQGRVRFSQIVIYNADSHFKYRGLAKRMTDPKVEGFIPCSRENGDAWSFCDTAETSGGLMPVKRVTEKERISDLCSVGFYYFRDGAVFFSEVAKELNSAESEWSMRELFVAPYYNTLIKNGAKVYCGIVEEFRPFGTVEQIQDYWGLSLAEIRQQNSP